MGWYQRVSDDLSRNRLTVTAGRVRVVASALRPSTNDFPVISFQRIAAGYSRELDYEVKVNYFHLDFAAMTYWDRIQKQEWRIAKRT